jgi:hypothetical protein
MKTTVSRRAVMAGIPAAAIMPAATQANGAHAPHSTTTDPVFAAIERHRQAVQAWQASMGEAHDADKISNQLLAMERDAFREWLTTPPTTLAGVIATLEHASRRPYPHDPDYPDDYIHTNLIETAEYLPGGDVLEAGEQFPAMIATALRKIGRETPLRNCYNILAHKLVLTA